MKKEKIDFNVELKDAFGEVIKERREEGKEKMSVIIGHSIIDILSNPHALPEDSKMDAVAIVKRLTLQQKVASKEPQAYSTDELGIIREATIQVFNKKMLHVAIAGEILKMTE